MKELYRLLVSSKDFTTDEVMSISNTLQNAIVTSPDMYPIEENGLCLRVIDTEDPNKIDVALWSNHLDEDGNRSVKMVSNDKQEILDALHTKYLERQESSQKKL